MLNRIYIVVGMLAIVVLAAAFIVPRFIQWSDYRDRMEVLASTVLGADVTIGGDIQFSLLPQPRLIFSDVVVGDPAAPAATVADVEAEFALMDFLRDDYTVTSLLLKNPVIDLSVDENGLLGSQVNMAPAGANDVALENARIENGTVRLTDQRAGTRVSASDIDGELRLTSFVGPFAFQGYATSDGNRVEVRFNSGAADSEGNARVSTYLREAGDAFSVTTEGILSAGRAPKFNGTMVYRHAPPAGETADDIRGDFIFESKVDASTDRVVLSGYTLQPDANRASLRLTGSANIRLGANSNFDAAVSGGVFSLPPRDATEVSAQMPYEVVRLLADLPAPPLPPIPGKLGFDLAEVTLRGFALRNVRLEATTDGTSWAIDQALASLPGETTLRLSGRLDAEGNSPSFHGDVQLESQRLDALAQIWRRPQEDNPLFNMPATLRGRVTLAGDAFGFNDGMLTLDGASHRLEIRMGFGMEPRLDLVGHFGDLDALHTSALMALLPDAAREPSFGVSFPEGSFSVTATDADVLGLQAADLIAEGQWTPNAVRFSRLSTTDWGGLSLSSTLRAAGTLAAPHLTGSAKIGVESADAPALGAIYELAAVPFAWQQAVERSFPADLQVALDDDGEEGAQVLTVGGMTANAALDFRAEMTGGLQAIGSTDLRLVASLEASDGADLLTQLGIGSAPLFSGDADTLATLFMEGDAANGLQGRASLSSGAERIGYVGSVRLADSGALAGDGRIEASLQQGNGLASLVGLEGAGLAGFEAGGDVRFEDTGTISLAAITGISGDQSFSGQFSFDPRGQVPSVSGSLDVDAVDASAVAQAVFGSAALIGLEPGQWPEGPLALAGNARPTRGAIAVTGATLNLGGAEVGGATRFDLDWEPQSVSLRSFRTAVGGGTVSLDLQQCCSGGLEDRTVSARVQVAGVNLDAVLPLEARSGLDGNLDAGVQVEGTGNSLAEVVRSLTGEGNFTVANFAARGLDTGVYPAVAGLDDVLNTDAATLESYIGVALGQGDFTASEARGAFSIAAGTARLANLIIEGDGGRLAGNLDLALPTLGLSGSFVLTPLNFTDEGGLVQPDSARIVNRIAGTLVAPETTLDLSEIVAAIQVRANELEVDRLEELRQADEARQREAAEARNRLIEAQKRQAAEAAALRAAEEEAQRRAEEEARQRALPDEPEPEEAAPEDPATSPNLPNGPLDLSFPGVNQPSGNPVNQPLN